MTQTSENPAEVSPPVQPSGETLSVIDLRFLLAVLWRHKWLFLGLVAVGGLYGANKMHKYIPTYPASMVVAPLPEDRTDLSGGISKVSGFAQTLGIPIGKQLEAPELDRLKLVMGSVALARRIQDKYGLLQRIHENSWQEDSRSWARPAGTRFEWEQKVRSFLNLATWQPPSVESLARYLESNITFEPIEATDFLEITCANPDPDFSLWLLETAYEEADSILRERDRTANKERKDYLEKKLIESTIVEMRQTLAAALFNEEQKSMMLVSDLPYAALVIEPAYASRFPTTPSVVKLMFLPIAILVALGMFFVLVRMLLRTES